MAKMKKVGDKYLVDCRVGGRGSRILCDTREQARELVRKTKLERAVHNSGALRKSVEGAIAEYVENVTDKKGGRAKYEEPRHFAVFQSFMSGLGIEYVDEIELIHLTKLQTHLLKKVSAGTVNRKFGLYNHFFTMCRLWKFHPTDPSIDLQPLMHQVAKRPLWTDADINTAIKKAPYGWAKDVFWFTAMTGARPIECCRLVWSDVDFSKGTITLSSFKGRKGQLKRRQIPMTGPMREFLAEIRLKQPPRIGGTDGHVFLNTRAKPLNSVRISRLMRNVADKMGLKAHSLYGIRHTLFTDMAERDVSQEKIRQLAGHSDIRTTSIYTNQVSSKSLQQTLDDATGSKKFQR